MAKNNKTIVFNVSRQATRYRKNSMSLNSSMQFSKETNPIDLPRSKTLLWCWCLHCSEMESDGTAPTPVTVHWLNREKHNEANSGKNLHETEIDGFANDRLVYRPYPNSLPGYALLCPICALLARTQTASKFPAIQGVIHKQHNRQTWTKQTAWFTVGTKKVL